MTNPSPDTITQKYLRRWPSSKEARSWAGRMVHIQTENGVWRKGGCGYTWAGKPDAWVLPFEDAVKQVAHCGPEKMARFIDASSSMTSPDTSAAEVVARAKAAIARREMTGSRGETPENIYNITADLLATLDTSRAETAAANARAEAAMQAQAETAMAFNAKQEQLAEAINEANFLKAKLRMIADIAEGFTTANTLQHIAKIARGLTEIEGKSK